MYCTNIVGSLAHELTLCKCKVRCLMASSYSVYQLSLVDRDITLTHPLQVTVIWEVTAYKGLSFIWIQKSKFHHKSPAGFIFCWVNDKLVANLFKVFLVYKKWSILKGFMEQLQQILKAAFPIAVSAMWYLQFQNLYIGNVH